MSLVNSKAIIKSARMREYNQKSLVASELPRRQNGESMAPSCSPRLSKAWWALLFDKVVSLPVQSLKLKVIPVSWIDKKSNQVACFLHFNCRKICTLTLNDMAALVPVPVIQKAIWAQCENPNCEKWRKLPPGTVVSENEPWYCYMNPDSERNTCSASEEVSRWMRLQ